MYSLEQILNKLNADSSKVSLRSQRDEIKNITDVMGLSVAEVKKLAGDKLTPGEIEFLHNVSQQQLKKNKLTQISKLASANAAGLQAMNVDNEALTSVYAKPGAVESMFSPAAYLTELYREAKDLHADTSEYHLDKRRPDLATLQLSETNMNAEVSTLSLSNEILLNKIQQKEGKNYDQVMEKFASHSQTFMPVFNLHYETVRQAILLKDPKLLNFMNAPEIRKLMGPISLLAMQEAIMPSLYQILTEEVNQDNAIEIFKKIFDDVNVTMWCDKEAISKYYNISTAELDALLNVILTDKNELELFLYLMDDSVHKYFYDPEYVNDKLIMLSPDYEVDSTTVILIKRTYLDNPNQLHYADLIPEDTAHCYFNYSIADSFETSSIKLGTNGSQGKDLLDSSDYVKKDADYKVPINLGKKRLNLGVTIGVTRYIASSSGFRYSSARFEMTSFCFEEVILKINKFIRFYKATELSLSEIQTLIENFQGNTNIDAAWVNRYLYMHHYMKRYNINVDEALVLCNATINDKSFNDAPSAFDQLFNASYQNDGILTADGSSFQIESDPAAADFRQAILKKALQVNDNDLLQLMKLTYGYSMVNMVSCDLDFLSALYRVRLLAEVHHLTISELVMLLSLFFAQGKTSEELGEFDEDLEEWIVSFTSMSDENFAKVIDFIFQYTQWLQQKQWSVSDIYIMTMPDCGVVMTADMKNLLTTILNSIRLAEDSEEEFDEVQLKSYFAPYIGAAMQLTSNQMVLSVLNWADQIKPNGLTFYDFITLIIADSEEINTNYYIRAFSQVMMQLSMIVCHLGLNEEELTLVVKNPGLLQQDAVTLGYDLITLKNLSHFHDQMNQFGNNSSDVLNALMIGKFSAQQLSQTLNLNNETVQESFNQVGNKTLSSSDELATVLQWLQVSERLSITPDALAALIESLKYSDQSTPTSYEDWAAISKMLQAGLNDIQSESLKARLEEKISTVLSAYYINNIAPIWLADREQLYSYLLIDNLVSPEIKTTRLAAAISAIQLYVNRTLAYAEDFPKEEVLSRSFFINWDKYNKRYHTWSGVALLTHYPENYVDPISRIGQTEMFNELLESISQTQLDTDTVEDAFKTYMTRFENIANLDVVSGYHDAVNIAKGSTYFIGQSVAEGGHYYWHALDHSQFSEGEFPANAWSEWKKINMAITPVNQKIRPVIFKSRLHLVWLEKKTISIVDDSAIKKAVDEYQLKISYILHDGSWSTPNIIDTKLYIDADFGNLFDKGFYCSYLNGQDALIILFYEIKTSPDQTKSTTLTGFYVFSDGSSQLISSAEIGKIRDAFYQAFDLTGQKKIISICNPSITTMPSAATDNYGGFGIVYLSKLENARLYNISVVSNDEKSVSLKADANLDIVFSNAYRVLPDIMKKYGKMGDQFYISANADYSNNNTTREIIYSVYQVKSSETGKGRLLAYCNVPFSKLEVDFGDGNVLRKSTSTEVNYMYIDDEGDSEKYLKGYELRNAGSKGSSNTQVESSFFLDTSVDNKDVEITVSVGEYKKTFSAEQYVEKSKIPSLNFDRTSYPFTDLTFEVPLSAFQDDIAVVWVEFAAKSANDAPLGAKACKFSVYRVPLLGENLLTVDKLSSGAQFFQYGPYRTRLNTLFAEQLVARANSGIDVVLSMETQYLPEPPMGDGGYIRVTLPSYDAAKHGSSRQAKLTLWRGRADEGETAYYTFWSGSLTDDEQSITLFVPLTSLHEPFYSIINFPYSRTGGLKVYLTCETGRLAAGTLTTAYEDGHLLLTGFTAEADPVMIVSLLQGYTEPMNFNGSNALYFWEMFYYVPVMIFNRFLQEQRFQEATHWLKYIWSPEGYYVEGHRMTYNWNCRPLEEDTSWNTEPEELTDPDTLAQHDPMHYKMATFMNMVELLIARGDTCYRQLETDTLDEAKMWYVQALSLFGEKSVASYDTEWPNPQLDDAVLEPIAPFLPQENEKMLGYRQLLEQRLYNLRHNLSIDGQPLSLPIYASIADPASLHTRAVNASASMNSLSKAMLSLYRFPVILESAKSMVSQLMQFGSALLNIIERQDAEALAELLQTQGNDLSRQSIQIQEKTIAEIDADKKALLQSQKGVQSRLDSYRRLYDENINAGEQRAMDLYNTASAIALGGTALHTTAAVADLAPNIFGLADGGSHWGAIPNAMALGTSIDAGAKRIDADKISQSEVYRRRRQEWEIQRNAAESEVKQIEAQLGALDIRHEAAVLQKKLIETQQTQAKAQLTFLYNKLSNKALYHWLRGRLAVIYNTFYDLSVSRCLMAEKAWQWYFADESLNFIRPANVGFLAGESLMLNLAQMEKAYLEKDQRALEVTRTVSLAEFYQGLSEENSFIFKDQAVKLLQEGQGEAGTESNTLKLTEDRQLIASINLSDLNIKGDYPAALGSIRRIKQISVTLPALIGPYQDVRAVLSYGGSMAMPRGCSAVAISHGMSDSGQFQLDFNDPRYLPFEWIPVDDSGNLTLSFPDATGEQKALLQSLSDIILHIRYTIQK